MDLSTQALRDELIYSTHKYFVENVRDPVNQNRQSSHTVDYIVMTLYIIVIVLGSFANLLVLFACIYR